MPTVKIPTSFRDFANGEATVESDGRSIAEIVDGIRRQYPKFYEQLTDDNGNLSPFVNVYLNDDDIRYLDKLNTRVSPQDVISILPAVAGG